jgi:hypothetical protein
MSAEHTSTRKIPMNIPADPQEPSYEEPVAGVPLIVPPVGSEDVAASVEPDVLAGTPSATPAPPMPTEQPEQKEEQDEDGGGKMKAAALLAGAAALANKVRQEAPKKVQEIREKRVAGRCVILTEADGRSLAIGPYKNDEAAREDIFKVGGTPRVIELVSETAFFAPHESSHA